MDRFILYGKKLRSCSSFLKLACFWKPAIPIIVSFFRYILLVLNPFLIHLLYFLAISTIGFFLLRGSKTKTMSFKPRNFDLFFMSVSAATVSSMSTVEMEVFSNEQLFFLAILMFLGGEVFTSMVELHLGRFKLRRLPKNQNKIGISTSFQSSLDQGIIEKHGSETSVDREYLKYKSIKFLSYVLLGYLLVILILGVSLVFVYVSHVSSAKNVLQAKGLKLSTFSVFTVVSTFANCGFIPTNENMIVFRKNPGLFWILIPQILLGNTLFSPFLRFSIWIIGKFIKKNESSFLLKNSEEIGFLHFLPSLNSSLLVVTVVGFIIVQFVLFCSMEWNSTALSGMTSYEKIVGIIFQAVNTRHAGESIVDLSAVTQAVLVLFVVMMYFPPYTCFLPVKDHDDEHYPQECERKRTKEGKVVKNFIFSQLSYLVLFIILICITEKKRMKEDPLNFNVLNIVVEVISAYGNVGYSTGYSCSRQLKPNNNCQDKWFGFSGKWSGEGKLILIFVMFYGRLKKFNISGGRAWKLM